MHALSPYMVTVVDIKTGSLIDLWKIQNTSLYEYLKNIYYPSIKGVQKITQTPTNSESGKNYIFKDLYKGDLNSVAGFYSSGEFGFETDVIDTTTNAVVFSRGSDQSDMRPFQFSFYFPKSSNQSDRLRGILLLYRNNSSGIRGMVMPDLLAKFQSAFPGLRLIIEKIVPTAVVTSVLSSGSIRKIRLIQNSLPSDYSKVLTGNDVKNFYEFEAIIKPKPRTPFKDINWLINAVKNKTKPSAIFTIPNSSISRVKVEVVNGSKKRTIDVGDLDKISPVIEITAPTLGTDGHIDPQSWLDEADSLADDLFSEIGVVIPKWNSLV